MSDLRVVIAGGGTGGHISPAVAVAESLCDRNPSTDIMFMGSSKGIEARIAPSCDYETALLDVPRSGGLKGLPVRTAKMALAVAKAASAIRRFKPHVVVGTGGFASVAPAVAAKSLRLPLIILEQNAVPGRANRLLSRIADEVHTQFPDSVDRFPHQARVRVTGNPVRKTVFAAAMRRRHRAPDAPFTLLVMGGSQGAHSINQALGDALPRLAAAMSDMRVLHCAGVDDEEYARARLFSSGLAGRVWGFNDQLYDLYANADLAVCRAGATSLAERAVCGLPAILIPYPFASDRHQHANARVVKAAGAARVIEDSALNGATLAEEILSLVADPARLENMGAAMQDMAQPDAGPLVVDAVERLAGIAAEPDLPIAGDAIASVSRIRAA